MITLKQQIETFNYKLKNVVKGKVDSVIIIEKIEMLKKEIREFEDDPSNYEIKFMLMLHRKKKDFEYEFLQGKALKNYKLENEKVSNFITKNTSRFGKMKN